MSTGIEKKIFIVLPAYNAAQTLMRTLDEIPLEYRQNIILVDDASTDNTVEIARQAGLTVIVHPENRGYGGNQKTCYCASLERGADLVVMLHPDHQYDAKVIPQLIKPILSGEAHAVFGSRMLGGQALEGGMSVGLFCWTGEWTMLAPARGKRHRRDLLAVLARLPLNVTQTAQALLDKSRETTESGVTPLLLTAQALHLGLSVQLRSGLVVVSASEGTRQWVSFPDTVDFTRSMPATHEPVIDRKSEQQAKKALKARLKKQEKTVLEKVKR